jgi:hypothetical protein
MTAAQYKSKRKKVGTWKAVAEMLGLNWSTIARREAGTLPITKEAALAIDSLAGRAAGAGGVPKPRRTKKGKALNKQICE